MRGSARKVVRAGGWIAAALAVGGSAWLLSGGHRALRPWLERPETGIRRALGGAGSRAPHASASGDVPLRLDRVRFSDLIVDAREAGAEVVGIADADGEVAWRGQPVALAYLGRERFTMVRCAGEGWCVEGERLPRLAAVVAVLSRRAAAFADADAEAYRPLVADGYQGAEGGKAELLRRLAADLAAPPRARLRPLAWQVRVERETAQVGEDYELQVGDAPARRLRARLDLREEGGRWRFTGGL